MDVSRKHAAMFGRETVQILEAGRYTTPDGHVVDIADLVQRAADGTCTYPEGERPGFKVGPTHATRFAAKNQSTLAAARRLADAGARPAALNFASAKHPGGGFLNGARAQEESLARSSALYACINGNPMYAFHQDQRDPLYSDYAIYSPDVPVFRDDAGALLAEPYLCTFITCPAVNAKVVLQQNPRRRPAIKAAMATRVRKVLAVAAHHGHEALVLGAWGCGVFGNDCDEVAELFREALASTFAGVFAEVVFAVLDWSPEQRFLGPFRDRFGKNTD